MADREEVEEVRLRLRVSSAVSLFFFCCICTEEVTRNRILGGHTMDIVDVCEPFPASVSVICGVCVSVRVRARVRLFSVEQTAQYET